jgi:glycosyltransferase involved in cell wall biosynthesis
MRVLHVIPSLALAHGGPSVALPVMERALTVAGVEVETLTTDDDGPGRRVAKLVGQPIEENGVRRWYFRKQSEFYKFSLPLYRWLTREVHRFDLVHIHAVFAFPSVAAAWAARRSRIPYVIRPLGVLNRYGMTRRRALLKRVSVRAIEGPLLRDAAAVHFTSREEQTEVETLGWPHQSAVIPLGLEPPEPAMASIFRSRHPEIGNRRCILFLSRLDPKKNVECLLRAVAKIRSKHDLGLIVCGDGEAGYKSLLKKLGEVLGLGDAVVWAGHVDGEVKQSAFACAELFVLPSYSENFGIAAAEALMAGLPCVLSHGVAIAAEVDAASAGLAVAPRAEEIAAGICRFMDVPAMRLAAQENAKRLALEKYSAAAMGSKLVKFYREISLDRLRRK